MRKRVHIALAVLLVALAGVIAWQAMRLREREPVYQGRTLYSWLSQYAAIDRDRASMEAAESAIRRIGTNGLPTLLAWARRRDSPFKKKMCTLLGQKGCTGLQIWTDFDYHGVAAYGFKHFGSIAKPAVPSLIRLLSDTDPEMRVTAAICLADIGPAAEEAAPALLQNLDDPKTQQYAFNALRSISTKPDVVVPVLIGFLSSTNTSQQCWALSSLSYLGADAKSAVPKVLGFLDAPRLELRQAATDALISIDPEAAAQAGVK